MRLYIGLLVLLLGVGWAEPRAPSCTPTPTLSNEPVARAPLRLSVGKGFVMTGVVRARDCTPLAGISIIYWLANARGQVDPTLRGAVLTDRQGRYRFESPPAPAGSRIYVAALGPGYQVVSVVYVPQRGQTQGQYDLVLTEF